MRKGSGFRVQRNCFPISSLNPEPRTLNPTFMTAQTCTIPDNAYCADTSHVIIAGYGVPGRAVAEWAHSEHLPFCVIELNAAVVERCSMGGTRIVEGSVTDEAVLKSAGIATALAIFLAVPDEQAVLEAVRLARSLNPTIKIVARVGYISTGFEAKARGADEVIVAEQVVASELAHAAAHIVRR